MVLRLLEFALGLVLATSTLADVFETVVTPGASRGLLKVSRRLVRTTIRPAKRLSPGKRRLPRGFAPFILLTAFLSWMVLLILAFGLMVHSLRDWFSPQVHSFAQALYIAGSACVTIGMSEVQATGPARWLILFAAVCGLSVMTTTITYVLQVQSGLHEREAGVLKLSTGLGRPPTGLELIEAYGRLGCRSELRELFREWRDWSASVLQSHSAHPALVYFRSVTGEGDWTAALAAVLDAAAFTIVLLDSEAGGVAALCHREGARLAKDLAGLFELKPAEVTPVAEEAVRRAAARMEAAGYRVAAPVDAPERLSALRCDYVGWLCALADRIGLEGPPRGLLRRGEEDPD